MPVAAPKYGGGDPAASREIVGDPVCPIDRLRFSVGFIAVIRD